MAWELLWLCFVYDLEGIGLVLLFEDIVSIEIDFVYDFYYW